MHATKIAPQTTTSATTSNATATTRRHRAAGTITGTAAVYRPEPTPAHKIDAWARHACASNGFGGAGTEETPTSFVLPYWKSR